MDAMRDTSSGVDGTSPQQLIQAAGPAPDAAPVAPVTAEAAAAMPAEAQQPMSENDDEYAGPGESYVWTASEFVAHQKNSNWYMLLGLSTVLITVLAWLLS